MLLLYNLCSIRCDKIHTVKRIVRAGRPLIAHHEVEVRKIDEKEFRIFLIKKKDRRLKTNDGNLLLTVNLLIDVCTHVIFLTFFKTV